MNSLQKLLIAIINVYTMIIFVRALISWFRPDQSSEWYRWLIRLTEPVLEPIRRILPRSGMDFSPLILLLALNFLKNFIAGVY